VHHCSKLFENCVLNAMRDEQMRMQQLGVQPQLRLLCNCFASSWMQLSEQLRRRSSVLIK